MLEALGSSPTPYAQRRQRLLDMVGDGAVVIVSAAPECVRSRDSLYPYRQDSNFWYLTGFAEPEAVLVLAPGRAQGEVVLFCRPRDPVREAWDGPRIGPERAPEVCAVDAAWPITELPRLLPQLLEGREQVYAEDLVHVQLLQGLEAWKKEHAAHTVLALSPLVHEMRLFKEAAEVALMRRAASISVEAHLAAMHAARPGLHEYQLQAELEYIFGQHGAVPAYESIVGAGANACILHYRANHALMHDGDLVLIDAGCEYRGYAADITRTFPVNGRFNAKQRAIYEIVYAAHAAALDKARPGIAYDAIHTAAVEVLSDGLMRLGLITQAADYTRFYPHKSGHWLGLDVHDVGAYALEGVSRPLQAGMVLTIEPGLYIPAHLHDVAPEWHGIGIRIEDDVLITADGHDILTAGLARSADEVEAQMARD